jgi:F-type H+-transporting ATPase subunit alpha
VIIIYAATNGFLDSVAVEHVRAYETELYQFLDTRRAQLLSSLAEKKQIDDQIKANLTQTLKEFGDGFAAARKTAAA